MMNITIYPQKLSGSISVIPSKSEAHRILICAAFSDKPTDILCSETNQDIDATVGCLNALGAEINRTDKGFRVLPIVTPPKSAMLHCYESGSTLRFILPIVCALGVETTIEMSGRLPKRPLSPLWEELERMGCTLTRPTETSIHTTGHLACGEYRIAGNVSSQFITGLLFALALLNGKSHIVITEKLESRPYVEMTRKILSQFGVTTTDFRVQGCFPFRSPGKISVEGDWSNGSFFYVAEALGNALKISNLSENSMQGDRAVTEILANKKETMPIDSADIPDLIPILAVYFAANGGAVFTNIARLRLKESDRVASVTNMLRAFGIRAVSNENSLEVFAGEFCSGVIDACNDHRIAMAAGIATTIADGPVTILGAECVNKSYPTFWSEYRRLGGHYEQYLR